MSPLIFFDSLPDNHIMLNLLAFLNQLQVGIIVALVYIKALA